LVSRSSAATLESTPMRRMRSGCCARAANGNAAAEPTTALIKSRRLIAAPDQDRHRIGLGYHTDRGECPLWVKSRHVRCEKACPLCPQQRPRKRTSANRHVCFTPKSGHVQCNYGCPLWANSGHLQCDSPCPLYPNSDIDRVFRHVCFRDASCRTA